ncbi:hypothetical protein O1L60_36225 [Streptomyces diastatochromogenes]|nr:hypothetical protein [Streptomyces diastatochromogenes]
MAVRGPPDRRRRAAVAPRRPAPAPADRALLPRPRGHRRRRALDGAHHTGPADGHLDPIAVDRLDSASWTAPPLPDYRIGHLVGGWNSEFQLQHDRLPVAETVLTSRRGLTGHHASPG